jgi:hypothetical protein
MNGQPNRRVADGKQIVTVVMDRDLVSDLDILATRRHTTRSAVIIAACLRELEAAQQPQP